MRCGQGCCYSGKIPAHDFIFTAHQRSGPNPSWLQLLRTHGFSAGGAGGIRVAHLGTSSVRYEVGLFADDAHSTNACGQFVHVYVDKASRSPVPLALKLKTVLETLF
jgi:hypothetical protein